MNYMKKNKHKGQSLVEFGIVLPALLLLVFGFLDLGRAVYYYSAIGNAAREGARYASVHWVDLTTEAGQQPVKDVVKKYAVSVGIENDKITFPVTTEDYVTVKITFDFVPVTPFINTLQLQSESTMMLAPAARVAP